MPFLPAHTAACRVQRESGVAIGEELQVDVSLREKKRVEAQEQLLLNLTWRTLSSRHMQSIQANDTLAQLHFELYNHIRILQTTLEQE